MLHPAHIQAKATSREATPLPGPPTHLPPAPRVMPGFIPSAADGLLKVDTPKGAQKPLHPFVTPMDNATPADPPNGHPKPGTGTVTRANGDTSAQVGDGRMPRSKSNLGPGDSKRRKTAAAQQGAKGRSGGARVAEKARGQSEEVEEGELEPGERAAGYESGEEEQRGAPAPAGPHGA